MKQIVLKVTLVVAVIFGFMLINNVKAYNLKWDTKIATNSKGEKVVRIQMSAGASDYSISEWKKWKEGHPDEEWNTDEYTFQCGTTTNYSSEYTTFHRYDELTTTYYEKASDAGNNYVKIHYLTKVNGGKDDYRTAYISKEEEFNPSDRKFIKFPTNRVSWGYKIDEDTKTSIFIREFNVKNLKVVAETLGYTDTTKEQTLRMSTVGCTEQVGNGKGYNKAMDTTWKYYATIAGYWYTNTYGYDVTTAGDNYTQDNKYIYPQNCTANEYDNIVTLPALDEKSTEVYVRHVDKAGNVLNVSNSTQTLSDKTKLSNLGPKEEYTEYYELLRNQTLNVSYKGKYVSDNNKVYEFTNSKYGESTLGLEDAEENITDRGDTTQLEASDNGKKKYIVIEFVYEEVPETFKEFEVSDGTFSNLSLSGKISSNNNIISISQVTSDTYCATSDKNEDKNVLYVPASEKVNLSINSQQFFYKKLTQKPYLDKDGKLNYYLVAEIYVLTPNSSKAKNSTDSGTTFFGNSNESVVNLASPFTLKNGDTFTEAEIVGNAEKYIKNNLKVYVGNTTARVTNASQVTLTSAGTKTSNSGDLNILSSRYNGKRVVAGESLYSKYTFTFKNDIQISNNNNKLTVDTNSTNINIYTPLDVSHVKIYANSQTIINHSDNKDATQIQKGSKFTIDPKKNNSFNYPGTTSSIDTSKYANSYKLVFDFEVNGKPAGTIFTLGKDEVFNGEVTGDINQANNSFKIMGITNNEPSVTGYQNATSAIFDEEMQSTDITTTTKTSGTTTITSSGLRWAYKQYIDKGSIGKISVQQTACSTSFYTALTPGVDLKEGAFYRVINKVNTINIGRIYGFRITDCSDVNLKNVFRNTNTETGSVNSITGTVYFSGKKVYDYMQNSMITAKDLKGATNTIPLGPYKSTNSTYIFAPKLGYRISFDLKTSGYYDYYNAAENAQRTVTITPSYYFIKKDGTGYTDEVKLYYKNDSGTWKQFTDSGYTISFTPKDGYRHTFDNNSGYSFNTDIMSSKLVTLSISKTFELYSGNGTTKRGMMAIDESSNNSVQVWFGEFKLPNSTIIVSKDNNYDVNNPLKDGYIGVKFDIKCIDKNSSNKTITLSYNQNNLASNAKNTTQWDYDQYLGYSGAGSEFNTDIPIQLEKGIWHINSQTEWDKIRGTVIFYDTDNRASEDFD